MSVNTIVNNGKNANYSKLQCSDLFLYGNNVPLVFQPDANNANQVLLNVDNQNSNLTLTIPEYKETTEMFIAASRTPVDCLNGSDSKYLSEKGNWITGGSGPVVFPSPYLLYGSSNTTAPTTTKLTDNYINNNTISYSKMNASTPIFNNTITNYLNALMSITANNNELNLSSSNNICRVNGNSALFLKSNGNIYCGTDDSGSNVTANALLLKAISTVNLESNNIDINCNSQILTIRNTGNNTLETYTTSGNQYTGVSANRSYKASTHYIEAYSGVEIAAYNINIGSGSYASDYSGATLNMGSQSYTSSLNFASSGNINIQPVSDTYINSGNTCYVNSVNSTTVQVWQVAGNQCSYIDTNGAYNQTSNLDKKENFEEIHDSLMLIEQLKPMKYNYKHDKNKKVCAGLILEDVKEIEQLAHIISDNNDALKYTELIPYLIDCIISLKQKNDINENKILTLTDDIAKLKVVFKKMFNGVLSMKSNNNKKNNNGEDDLFKTLQNDKDFELI